MTAPERPAPTILDIRVSDERQLTVQVTDPQTMTGYDGKVFQPDRFFAKWIDGALHTCTLSGTRINKDGSPHVRGDRSCVNYMVFTHPGIKLADDAPQWVHELVARYWSQGGNR